MTPPSYTYKNSYTSTMKHYIYGLGGLSSGPKISATSSYDARAGAGLSYDVEHGVLTVMLK